MPTSTVEDYLKAIWIAEDRRPGTRVTTGGLASALSVTPGTATSMVKTLAETGLVDYEPYAGVRLTDAGSELATRVLRRHRMIEQFLVEVLGLDWSEVHREAEILEHAVSDRVLEKMDAVLGSPRTDPHGDPIPSASGRIERRRQVDLLEAPTGRPLTVSRVSDQRPEFLRLLERHGVVPGRSVRIGFRDPLTETVSVVPEDGTDLRLGFRAAAAVWVDAEGVAEDAASGIGGRG